MKNPPVIPADVAKSIGLLWCAFSVRVFGFDTIGTVLGYAVLLYAPLYWERNTGLSVTFLMGAGNPKQAATTGLIAGLLACSFFILLWSLSGNHFPWVGTMQEPDYTRLISGTAVSSVILYPLVEEFFFRGYVQQRLLGTGTAPRNANLIQASLFGLTHVISFMSPAGLLTVIPGLIMGELRQRTGHLASSLVFHMLANALVLIW